ncbi:MAG: flagellar protein FlaG [Selenomonadaceae bacterium]|nr:flagellar protein FlaG [Selenomonadaceae bacterium]
MIGKVQDVMAGAIVIGAADKAASSVGKAANAQPQPASEVSEIERMQDEWNANGGIAPVDSADQQKMNGEDPGLDEKSVSLITDELNELMEKINCDIAFKYHKEVNMMSVSMINKKTEEVIKELPPEEMIDNIKKAREWIGAFLDKNA